MKEADVLYVEMPFMGRRQTFLGPAAFNALPTHFLNQSSQDSTDLYFCVWKKISIACREFKNCFPSVTD